LGLIWKTLFQFLEEHDKRSTNQTPDLVSLAWLKNKWIIWIMKRVLLDNPVKFRRI